MHICHLAGVINCPYNRHFILDFEMEKSVITCQFYLNHLLTPFASCSLVISSTFYLTLGLICASNPFNRAFFSPVSVPNDDISNVKTMIFCKILKNKTGCQNQENSFWRKLSNKQVSFSNNFNPHKIHLNTIALLNKCSYPI